MICHLTFRIPTLACLAYRATLAIDTTKHRKLEIHSTRLFPKHKGAHLYQITGIAARCDWILLSDDYPPHTHLIRQREGSPRTVFVSLRSPFHALAHFFKQVLPCIRNRFTLISGSEDVTLPLQNDHRWRQYTEEENAIIAAILNDERLITWAAENLVSTNHPRWQPLPLGMLPHDLDSDPLQALGNRLALAQRPTRILCAHRLHQGPQWQQRRRVSKICSDAWRYHCSVIEREVPPGTFKTLIHSHSFVICANGGGIDPCPKAWQVMLEGSIPIICGSGLNNAYKQLPVIILPEWKPEMINYQRLKQWKSMLQSYYMEQYPQVRHRLTLDYWWDQILAPNAQTDHLGLTIAVDGCDEI